MYEWLKALHILAVISWMAGLLYLPRLFVYHTDSAKGSVQSETFKIMERRLFRAIMTPAMIASWIFGISLFVYLEYEIGNLSIWVYVKFITICIMTVFHFYLGRVVKIFAVDQNEKLAVFYRAINELPTVLMIVIVLMVVLKPF